MTIKNLEILRDNHQYRINNLNGFIEFVQLMSQNGYSWFRGQSVSDWDIEPSLSRNKIYPPKYKELPSSQIKIIHYETTDFNDAIDEAIHIVQTEPHYKEIKQLNLSRLQFILLAQHYGLITPTLDWSTNPNIALFFSLFHDKNDPSFSPILYATNPKILNFTSPVHVKGKSIYNILPAEDKNIEEFINQELENIEGTNNNQNSFVWPIAIESNLDFSHRITFQSGKFTINGPKKPFENVSFKNTTGIDKTRTKTPYLNISAEINMNNENLVSDLEIYLKNFGYTSQSVLRLGDSKSKLLDDLFSNIQKRHNNYPSR